MPQGSIESADSTPRVVSADENRIRDYFTHETLCSIDAKAKRAELIAKVVSDLQSYAEETETLNGLKEELLARTQQEQSLGIKILFAVTCGVPGYLYNRFIREEDPVLALQEVASFSELLHAVQECARDSHNKIDREDNNSENLLSIEASEMTPEQVDWSKFQEIHLTALVSVIKTKLQERKADVLAHQKVRDDKSLWTQVSDTASSTASYVGKTVTSYYHSLIHTPPGSQAELTAKEMRARAGKDEALREIAQRLADEATGESGASARRRLSQG